MRQFGCAYAGVYMAASNESILNNDVEGSTGYGIFGLDGSSNMRAPVATAQTISGNVVTGATSAGIHSGKGSTSTVISGNAVSNNGWGIEIDHDVSVTHNYIFQNTGAGLILMERCRPDVSAPVPGWTVLVQLSKRR